MGKHPNRSRARSPARNPTPEEIRAAREAAGLTQTAAADLLHTTCRTWQQWEAGDRRMHPAFWELFRLKTIAYPSNPLIEPTAAKRRQLIACVNFGYRLVTQR